MGAPSGPPLTKKDIITVRLWKSLHSGYGDADAQDPILEHNYFTGTLFGPPRYNRVHGSVDARWPGQVRFGMKVEKIAATNHALTPVFGVTWTDTNGIYPAIFYLVGKKIMKILFGAVTEVGTDALGSQNATGGMFDDDGSGIPYLYACFGGISGTHNFIRRMNRAQTLVGGVLSGATYVSTDVVAGQLLSLNGVAYRTVQPTSGTAECKVFLCPYGADRLTHSAWLDTGVVGFAGTPINVLTAVRQAPVAVKPEGIFAYNRGIDQWVNYTPSWRNFAHNNNGKGAYFLGDALVVPMGDGGAVIFDGNNVRPFDPGSLLATPNLHTTRDQFNGSNTGGAVSAMRHWIIGATVSPSKEFVPASSLRVTYKTAAGAFTSYDTASRDLDLTTYNTFTYAAGDKLYIGWTHPFVSVHFDFTGAGNTQARTPTVKVGTAAATFTTVGVKNTGFRDFTETPVGTPFGQNGSIVLMVDPVQLGWVQNTINGVTAYWMELTFSGALDLLNLVTVALSPWYPSIDTNNFPLDGLDKSGCFPHILYGRADPVSGDPWWHDCHSLPEPDSIGVMLYGAAGGTALNHSRQLTLIGRFAVWDVSIADNDRPGTESTPYLNNVGLIEGASFVPVADKLVRVKAIRVAGHDWDPAVSGFLYYSWDYGKQWSRVGGRILTLPAEFEGPDTQDFGHRFRWALGFKQSAAAATLTQPEISTIEVDFEVLSRPITETVGRKLQTLPRQ